MTIKDLNQNLTQVRNFTLESEEVLEKIEELVTD